MIVALQIACVVLGIVCSGSAAVAAFVGIMVGGETKKVGNYWSEWAKESMPPLLLCFGATIAANILFIPAFGWYHLCCVLLPFCPLAVSLARGLKRYVELTLLSPDWWHDFRETRRKKRLLTLSRCASSGHVEPIIKGLSDRATWVRCEAAVLLGKQGDVRAIGLLVKATQR